MKKLIAIFAVTSLIAFTGCEDYYDVNDDPNTTATADIQFVLPSAQVSTVIHVGGELFNLGGFWAQYYTQSPDAGQYENIDSYNISADFFDRTWSELYAGALKDLQYIKANSEDNNSYYLVAVLMEAYTYQVLVDLYDKVPYNDALGGEDGNLTPSYNNGEDIYASLLANIDAAMTRYAVDPSGPAPGSNDVIFGGNMDNWMRFGNTLKLRMLMRASNTSLADNAAVLALVNGGELLTIDARMAIYGSGQNKSNSFYDVNIDRLGGVNHAGGRAAVSYLEDNADDRLSMVYAPGSTGSFTTKPQGDFENRDISYAELASPIVSAGMPTYLFTVSEVDFLRAEALERFAGGAGAKAAYDDAITASFNLYGMRDSALKYYDAGGAYEFNTTGSSVDRLKQIATQKWISMANLQNLEAFFELNRTGFPEMKPAGTAVTGDLTISLASVLSGGNTPKRLLFAGASSVSNPNVPAQPAGGLSAPVWWNN